MRNTVQDVVFNVQMILTSTTAVAIWWHVDRDYDGGDIYPNSNVRNRMGEFFFVTTAYYCCFVMTAAFMMGSESMIVFKEIADRQYSAGLYFWSKSMVDLASLLPFLVIQIAVMFKYFHVTQTTTMFFVLGEVVLWNSVLGNSFGLLAGAIGTTTKTLVQILHFSCHSYFSLVSS